VKFWSNWRAKRKKNKKAKKREAYLKQRRIAQIASYTLTSIPERFTDDGCSYSPDSLFHSEIGWACRIHDFRYCSRSEGPTEMLPEQRMAADKELRDNLALSFPRWLGWVRFLYYRAVRRFGSMHAWDSCGYDAGERCKHNMNRPLWMEEDERERTKAKERT
jgi:hypothetical protein